MKHLIAPSILSADFANLHKDIDMINNSQADWIHIDIMDGVFVPNISIGFPVLKSIKYYSKKPLDVHLMIINPDQYIARFAEMGADIITIHYEACNHLHRSLQLIQSNNVKAGVAINPHTPVHLLENILDYCHLILIMSVNPGFGGQKFIAQSYNKIETLKNMIIKRSLKVSIEVDGGVNMNNAKTILNSGADILVAGNAIFNTNNPTQTIKKLKLM